MDDLLGRLEMEAPIITDFGDGVLEVYEKGIKYKLPNDRGTIRALFKDIESIEMDDKKLSLGKRMVRMKIVTPIGEVFNLSFAISEGYYYILKKRKEESL